MKKIIIIILVCISTTGISQNIVGKWNGEIKSIQFIFTIENNNGMYTSTIDVPTQRVSGIKPKSTTFEEGNLLIDGTNVGIKYQGTFDENNNQFIGTFSEGANSFPLTLKKGDLITEQKKNRPQEPVKPYPYNEEEVTFKNEKENITLSGTLTKPKEKKKYPVVVLISGSGPQDRDETFSGHKTFWVLADYLTRQGVAVLRYDDRGYGKSTGNFAEATTKDFSEDVVSAVNYLKSRSDIEANNIGLIGHSEGGIIAPLAANQTKDVSFIVLLASTGIPGSELIVMQSKSQRQFPVPDEEAYEKTIRKAIKIASEEKDLSIVKSNLKKHYNETMAPILKPLLGTDDRVSKTITDLVEMRTTPWMRYFYSYNPADELENLNIPVLSLNGSNDTQVEAKINQEGIRKALIKGKNKDYKIVELDYLNHLFQESKTGKMDEYNHIEQTFAPKALNEIATWIHDHLK